MLGLYNNFPTRVHRVTQFVTPISERTLQGAMVSAFHKLNNRTFSLEEVATPSVPQCTVIFEFGVAEGDDFNYLDDEEKGRLLKAIEKRLSTIDFLCVIRYYKIRNEVKTPLKFDYYMLRFVFSKKTVQMRVFHEKGLMYVSPKDLPGFIVDRVNAEFSRRVLKAHRVS